MMEVLDLMIVGVIATCIRSFFHFLKVESMKILEVYNRCEEVITLLFSNRDLKKLIIPLIIEQVLALTIGIFDTMMVSQCGQSAVSGVSIVDGLNVLIINIFSALATGGAVVCSQYIGKKDEKMACHSAKQLLFTILGLSLVIMVLCMIFNGNLLNLIFGHIESDVMAYARTYFFFSALSYPFIGLFNGGAALFRSMGNSKVAMTNSFYMNIGNIVLNYFFIFILNMLLNKEHIVHIDTYLKYKFDFSTVKRILKIGIPNGLENGMFQMGKILVQRLVSTFGTAAIAAHAVAFSLTSIAVVPGMALGLAILTVVGQCIGANDYQQAKYYTKKLMIIAYISTIISAGILLVGVRYILRFYALPQDTANLAVSMVSLHCVFDFFVWPMAFSFPNALRAANDATFTMIVSTFSMWTFRFALSYVFALYLRMGVIGVWWAMIVDWIFRSICFMIRYKSNKWMNRTLV